MSRLKELGSRRRFPQAICLALWGIALLLNTSAAADYGTAPEPLDPGGTPSAFSNPQATAPLAPQPDGAESPFAAPRSRVQRARALDSGRTDIPDAKSARLDGTPARLTPPDKLHPLTKPAAADSTQRSSTGVPRATAVLGSLAIVVGIFLLFAWLMKRGMPRASAMLPRDVVEVFGRAPLAKGHYVHLLRCGNKLLLVSISTAGAETLTEITDPLEVDRISGICQQTRPHSASAGFRQVFESLGSEPREARSSRTKSSDRLDLSAFAGIAAGRSGEADA